MTAEQRATVLENKPDLIQYLHDAHDTTERLLDAAMKVCDEHGDSDAARQDMREQCLETPVHLHADLLDHFTGKRRNFTKG